MELSPQDLGNERYLALLRRRLTPFAGTPNGVPVVNIEPDTDKTAPKWRRARGRRIRRYWVKDLGLDDVTAEKLSDTLWQSSPGLNVRVGAIITSIYLIIPMILTIALGAPALVPFLLMLLWSVLMMALLQTPRQAIRKLHRKKVTTTEVENMLPTARGRLERTYLNLAHDALRQTVPSANAEDDIRVALRELGNTISALPADAVPSVDSGTLRRESGERRVEAQKEQDSFVAASLLREADALERRARLADENAVSARRLSALRREARTQMDALRAVLVAFERTSPADATNVAHLSDAVQRVAQEAQAVSTARRELDEDEIAGLFGQPLPANLPAQPTLPARKIVTVPAPPPEQQQVVGQPNGSQTNGQNGQQSSGPWWRGQS